MRSGASTSRREMRRTGSAFDRQKNRIGSCKFASIDEAMRRFRFDPRHRRADYLTTTSRKPTARPPVKRAAGPTFIEQTGYYKWTIESH